MTPASAACLVLGTSMAAWGIYSGFRSRPLRKGCFIALGTVFCGIGIYLGIPAVKLPDPPPHSLPDPVKSIHTLDPFLASARQMTGASDSVLLAELQRILVLRAAGAASVERETILALPAAGADREELLRLPIVAALATESAARKPPDPLHFLHESEKDRFLASMGRAVPEGEACVRFRRELAEIARAFAELRASSRNLDSVPGDRRLPLTDWTGEAGLARYDFPKIPQTQNLPFFCAAEVDLLDRLRSFSNCPAARAALPPELYKNLYAGGSIPPLPQAFAVYGRTIRSRMADEYELAGKAFPKPTADKIRIAQKNLEILLNALTSTAESR